MALSPLEIAVEGLNQKRGEKSNGGDWSRSERRFDHLRLFSLSAPLHRDGKLERTAGFFPATSHCGVKAGRSPDIFKGAERERDAIKRKKKEKTTATSRNRRRRPGTERKENDFSSFTVFFQKKERKKNFLCLRSLSRPSGPTSALRDRQAAPTRPSRPSASTSSTSP